MEKEKHYRKLENMYQQAAINEIFLPRIAVSDGRAEISWEVKPTYFHAAHALHGAIYFKMLDDAAFFAANSREEEFFVLTSNFNLHFLRPVTKGVIHSVGEVIFTSQLTVVAEAKLYNEEGKEVAVGSGSFLKSRMALTEKIGYALPGTDPL